MISEAEIIKRKAALSAQAEKLQAELNAVLGARMLCDEWLVEIERQKRAKEAEAVANIAVAEYQRDAA